MRDTSARLLGASSPLRRYKVSSKPTRALPPSARPMAVSSMLALPIAMTCQIAPGGSRRTIVSRLSAVAAIPPRTPSTMLNCKGSASRSSAHSRRHASKCPVS
ncbi:Uncharacterised protein [Mycobacterium tuberculosis]|uniref:Uncharacterized protein n=1 Tax=Mycobacterium tuberculosis TaxID=1773 RepID=A0A655ECG3_MYCTX|nr:Uncharacterised protein [Mycobacterium tuberculosis]CNV15501.1 Uncharacterised protein [Mycobacterium tuberculosis]